MKRSGLKWLSRGSHLPPKRDSRHSERHGSHNTSCCTSTEMEMDFQSSRSEPHRGLQEDSETRKRDFQDRAVWEEKIEEEDTVSEDSEQKISERCEAELEERLRAIMALKSLVHSQRQTIKSLKEKHRAFKKRLNRRSGGNFPCSVLSFISEDESSFHGSTRGDDDLSELPRKYTVSFGPSLDKTDVDVLSVISYDDCDSIDLTHMEDTFKMAAEEIRKQASQMEVAIALDALETTKDELERTTKKLELRSKELEEVKEELKKEKQRAAMIEQERDLFEAEAVRTTENLGTYVAHLKELERLSCEAEEVEEELKKEKKRVSILEQERDQFRNEAVRTKADLNTCVAHLKKLELRSQELNEVKEELKKERKRVSMIERERDQFEAEAVRPKETLDTCVLRAKNHRKHSASDGQVLLYKDDSHCEASAALSSITEDTPVLPTEQGSLRTRIENWEAQRVSSNAAPPETRERHLVWSKTRFLKKPKQGTGGPLHHRHTHGKRLDWSPYGHSKNAPSTEALSEKPDTKDRLVKGKRLGLFGFQRHRDSDEKGHTKRSRTQKPEQELDNMRSLRNTPSQTGQSHGHAVDYAGSLPFDSEVSHLQQLDSRSESSSQTDDLRKRLNTVSRYYENVMGSLQKNIVDLKTEKTRLENDQKNHLSSLDHENRVALRNLESQVQERDALILKLRREKKSQAQDKYKDTKAPKVERPSSPRFC